MKTLFTILASLLLVGCKTGLNVTFPTNHFPTNVVINGTNIVFQRPAPPMPPRPKTVPLLASTARVAPLQAIGTPHVTVITNGNNRTVIITSQTNFNIRLLGSPMFPKRGANVVQPGPAWQTSFYEFFPPDPFAGRYFKAQIDSGVPVGHVEIQTSTTLGGAWSTAYAQDWTDPSAQLAIVIDANLPQQFVRLKDTP